jgi:VWFA-related protein
MGRGEPVADLKAEDFTVLDNGVPQTLLSFAAVTATTPHPADQIILVFDALNPFPEDMVPNQYGVEAYLRRDGGHLKIPITLAYFSYQGVSLAPASTDGNKLAAAVEKMAPDIRAKQRRSASDGRTEEAYHSIGAMEQLAAYAARLPGRKALVWVGPGWLIMSTLNSRSGDNDRRTLFAQMVQARKVLEQGNITVDQVLVPDTATPQYDAFLYQDFLKGPKTFDKVDTYSISLQVLATQTGGQVLLRDAALQDELERCTRDLESYYSVTYARPKAAMPDEFHEVVVKTDKPGTKVRTMRTYYAQP